MKSHRKAEAIAGVLFIAGTAAGLLSISPDVDGPDYLVKASTNEFHVRAAACFQFAMAAAYVGFAIALYPILRKHKESFAIGFVGFRLVAGAFNILGGICMLLLLTVSQEFVKAGTPESSQYQVLGGLLQAGRDMMNHVAMILAHSVGGVMLYCMLYETTLVPRWFSGWGFVGSTLAITASMLVMFGFVNIITPTYIALNLPIAAQELVLAVWLIIKGLNPSVIVAESEHKVRTHE